jgi:hypothetical protein
VLKRRKLVVGNYAAGEPAVAADGAGITVFRGLKFLQPAPLLNRVVRVRHDVVAVTVMHFGESDITCGAARSIHRDVRHMR